MPSMATLMQQSMDDVKFWFHELVYSCFESPNTRAWTAIRELLPNFGKLATVPDCEMDAFVESKMEQLSQYNVEWAAKEIDRKEAEFQALKERVERENAMLEAEREGDMDG